MIHQILVEEGAKILQNYSEWLNENMNDLVKQYSVKIIAIQNDEIVAVGESYQEIYALFENSNVDWMPLVIEVPNLNDEQDFLI